jgi:pimeloyl-ACP methyl ester carboxylesterase
MKGIDKMKKRTFWVLLAAIFSCVVLGSQALAQVGPTPPEQPVRGYGSAQKYICSTYERIVYGDYWEGTAVNVFIPARLKHGSKAPVVLFLHGYLAVFPDLYLDAIKHMTNQGYIVVFPTYNLLNPFQLITDTDQNVMLQRAIDNANRGLAEVGSRAELDNMIAFGHSLGGLFSICWNGAGGPRVREVVSANLVTDSSEGLPDFIKPFIKIIPVDWQGYAANVDIPVMILTGDQDTISGAPQATEMYNALTAAPSRVLYCLQGDDHGQPALMADHNASLTWFIPCLGWLLNFAGGAPVLNAMDYRFYWAAMDAAIAGKARLRFDMGNWSDGVPVKPVLQLAP